MKIATLNQGKGKSTLVNEIVRFTKCLSENVDDDKGLTYYRGVVYSYDEDVHCLLLGSDIDGNYKVIDIIYDGAGIKEKIKGVIHLSKICEGFESLLSTIDKIPSPLSKIYFDFCENVDVSWVNCMLFEDLSEVGSSVMMVEMDKSQVDTYMLKSCFSMCRGSLLCDSFSDAYMRLINYKGTDAERCWFKERGVKV